MSARARMTLEQVFGESWDPIASKLLSDVCGFLVAAGELDPGFRAECRAYLLGEPINGRSGTTPSSKAVPADSPVDGIPATGRVVEKRTENTEQPVPKFSADESPDPAQSKDQLELPDSE